MPGRDNLLERLEQVNPVPDPSRLYEDSETARHLFLTNEPRREKTSTGIKIQKLAPGPRGPRLRRGVLVGAATAVLVIIVGVALAFVTGDGTRTAGGESRVLQMTFDGQQCTYEGPTVLSAGEVEITYHNQSAERVWADFTKLDEGRSIQDLLDYNADPSSLGQPLFASSIWIERTLSANSSSTPKMAIVEPGLYFLTCGTWTPSYVIYSGSALTITP